MMRYLLLVAALIALFGCIYTGGGMMRGGSQGIAPGATVENRSAAGLEAASASEAVIIADGSTFQLRAAPVAGNIGGRSIRMLAYNGQLPGPVLKVKQGSSIYVNFTNNLDSNTTVHWHGIRLENKYDGVPDVTQPAVKPGESFLYNLTFPDEGIYWYHPHVKEENQQELGLYGVIIVEPNETAYYNSVDREEILILDDMLLGDGDVYPYEQDRTNFALMGRFGNVNMINGMTDYKLKVKKGQSVRFFVLDAANVRPYNLSIEGAQLKVVGSDGGKYEREFLADSIVITPSERYIFEASFNRSGTYEIRNINPFYRYVLGKIEVEDSDSDVKESGLKENSGIEAEIAKYADYFNKTPDLEYTLTIGIQGAMMGSMMMDHTEGGIEWEDTMQMMNRNSGSDRVTWIIKDKKTGKNNMDAKEKVPVNKPVLIKVENDDKSLHPMQHTIHIHGAQFLVLRTDGMANGNLVWKDSVNVPSGGSVELLAIFPKKGEWMMHCHIAEHLGSGMMTSLVAG